MWGKQWIQNHNWYLPTFIIDTGWLYKNCSVQSNWYILLCNSRITFHFSIMVFSLVSSMRVFSNSRLINFYDRCWIKYLSKFEDLAPGERKLNEIENRAAFNQDRNLKLKNTFLSQTYKKLSSTIFFLLGTMSARIRFKIRSSGQRKKSASGLGQTWF